MPQHVICHQISRNTQEDMGEVKVQLQLQTGNVSACA